MEAKQTDHHTGLRAVFWILGLGACFVAAGCGVLKSGGDEIGEGYLSEDGWDPFSDAPRSLDHAMVMENDVSDLVEAPFESVKRATVKGDQDKSEASQRVEDVFKTGDYDKALAAARSLRAKSAPGSTDRDVADFIVGASQYYLGLFHDAQATLDGHVKAFPSSRNRESALYYQASNHVRLHQWQVGASFLDNFIAAYPESLLMEFALFDRATCHFELGQNSESLSLVNKINQQFIYSKIRDRALALKGDVQQEMGDLALAQTSYQKAREAAEELKHADLEARCLANLVAVAAARGQSKEAVQFYTAFFKQFESSPHASKAAMGGLPALKASGDLDSGLANLEKVMQRLPQRTDASEMNELLVEYSKYYREKNGPEKLLRQLGNMSSSAAGSDRLKEQLIVARLEALETYFPEREAEIRVFYKEMGARFKPQDLSVANVLKLADYIAESKPDEAIDWYENALARGGAAYRARGTLGLAKAQAATGKDKEAEVGFRAVLETFGTPDLAEEATIGMGRIAQKKKDWSASAHYWTSYLDQKEWDLSRDEARNGLDAAKANGAVAKAPKSSHTLPVKTVVDDPVSMGLAKAQSQVTSGKKQEAYQTLTDLVARFKTTEGLPDAAKVSLRKAQMLHEDLQIELGM